MRCRRNTPQELAQLQANAPPMGWPFVKRRMAAELGAGLGEQLRELRARGRGGGLARPGASRDAARRPRARLQAAISRHGVGGGGRSARSCSSSSRSTSATTARSTPSEIHGEIADRLREELDYEREARAHGALSPDAGAASATCTCRSRSPELSTRRLLTMTWLEGQPLMQRARREAAAGGAQPHRPQHVPRLVRAVLRLRRDPWRPASRQLHGAAETATSTCSISAASASSSRTSSGA